MSADGTYNVTLLLIVVTVKGCFEGTPYIPYWLLADSGFKLYIIVVDISVDAEMI